jgi:hypothetical protein
MPPSHSVAFCNNRGGVGKTFMAFQTACEAARSRPDKKVLVVDFSLYSDITALMLGGSAREGFGAPMKGLQVTVEHTTADTRAEGLIRDLEHAASLEHDAPHGAASRGSVFGAFFSRPPKAAKTEAAGAVVDLEKYALRPAEHNPAIPPNLFLVPSAGATSWADTQEEEPMDYASSSAAAAASPGPAASTGSAARDESNLPLWVRKGDGWWPAARKLRAAVDRLPSDFDAVFFDTDHLAACVLTKLALATCESMVVPLSFDDGDFNRLFQDVTGNALFTDVALPMHLAGRLRAKVRKMVFTKVASTKNEPCVTSGGIDSPFKPSNTVMAQMDGMARQVWAACDHDERYRGLFRGLQQSPDPSAGGNVMQAFRATYFTAMKAAPDLAANVSKMCGLPIATMTTEKYVAPSGLEGQSSKGVLDGLKAEIQALTVSILDERYNKPIHQS